MHVVSACLAIYCWYWCCTFCCVWAWLVSCFFKTFVFMFRTYRPMAGNGRHFAISMSDKMRGFHITIFLILCYVNVFSPSLCASHRGKLLASEILHTTHFYPNQNNNSGRPNVCVCVRAHQLVIRVHKNVQHIIQYKITESPIECHAASQNLKWKPVIKQLK